MYAYEGDNDQMQLRGHEVKGQGHIAHDIH